MKLSYTNYTTNKVNIKTLRVFVCRHYASLCHLTRNREYMKKSYCWRCKKTLPFLDEGEWSALVPVLNAGRRKLTEEKDDPAVEARQQRAEAKFKEIAGEGDVSFLFN